MTTDVVQNFLRHAGWTSADRHPLAGDASARRYERLSTGDQTAILMIVPQDDLPSLQAFVRITGVISDLSLSAPRILSSDLDGGFLVLEDLGDAVFARVVDAEPSVEPVLYTQATRVLLHLARASIPPNLPDFRAQTMADAAGLAAIWYADTKDLASALTEHARTTLKPLDNTPPILTLRDFHAENMIWLPEREGLKQVGLLDYQDAAEGYLGYDLVSMIQDARRDVPDTIQVEVTALFARETGLDPDDLAQRIAVLGALRALRIIGVFARLSLAYGKPSYVDLIPRVWGQLQRNLTHPETKPLATWVNAHLPTPTPDHLNNLRARCGTLPLTR